MSSAGGHRPDPGEVISAEHFRRRGTDWWDPDEALWRRRFDDPTLRLLEKVRPGRLLEIGIGRGRLLERLALLAPKVCGVDVNPEFIAICRSRLEEKGLAVELIEASVDSLPFGDRDFDAVVSVEAFMHFPDQRGALAEIARVLKPGGFLVMSFIDRASWHGLLFRLRLRLGLYKHTVDFRHNAWRDVRDMAGAAGLKILGKGKGSHPLVWMEKPG